MVLTRAFLQTLCKNSSSYIDSSCVEEVSGSTSALDSSMAINEFLFSLNIDNINLVKLLQYIKESNIIHKVSDCPYTLLCIPCHSELSFISFYLKFPNVLCLRLVVMEIKQQAHKKIQHSKMMGKLAKREALYLTFKHWLVSCCH